MVPCSRLLNFDRNLLDIEDMSFSLSMSMSYGDGSDNGSGGNGSDGSSPTDGDGGSTPSITPAPTFTSDYSTSSPNSDTNSSLTNAPTITPAPTIALGSDFPSIVPTFIDSSGNTGGITPFSVFACDEDFDTVVLVPPPHTETTVVRLTVGYLVETPLNSTDDFQKELDWMIFTRAVKASLQCNSMGVLDTEAPGELLRASEVVGKCSWNE